MVDNYLFLYLDQLHCPPALMGLSLTINTVVEVPVFLFSGQILRWLGTPGVYHTVMAAYTLRLCWWATKYIEQILLVRTDRHLLGVRARYATFFGLTGANWAGLLAEPLHGVCFAVAWLATVQKVKGISPPGRTATFQSLITAVWFGAGHGLGGLVGGIVFERAGGPAAFRCGAAVVSAAWLTLVASGRIAGRWLFPRRRE